MKETWTLGKIAAEVEGRLSGSADPTSVVRDFHIRAWSCGPGSVFLPIFNAGPQMTQRALGRGAVGALVDTHLADSIPHIWVYDLQSAAMKLAQKRRASFDGQVVGITGSAGKSSTKAMLAQVLQSSGNIYASRNNQNLTPYVTATLCSLPPTTDVAIFELAMYSPDMVGKSSELAQPHIGIITSIGMNHAEYHDNPEEGIIKSKTEIFWGMKEKGTAILPSHDSAFEKLRYRALESGKVNRIIECGMTCGDDVRLVEAIEHSTYSEVTISAFGETARYCISVPGMHMIQNSLLVAATLKSLGKPLSCMAKMREYQPPTQQYSTVSSTF
ncbi:Mur ligase family protein [Yoonia sediminilitoris]|uniref:Mur ligase-like protein n=1 Tax=Yoonia sediminilitoris TaxID=1286148 RepID=A0A2T6KD16_9RHOB|nr:Mur ligase family protein [Yoonia sediminilitoris]PUB12837.1 Mur ligase-like protein [Yoonia sediminilitoris]RCW94316.1 Mur ligase-like protein [Yoonia sediminilitoris]